MYHGDIVPVRRVYRQLGEVGFEGDIVVYAPHQRFAQPGQVAQNEQTVAVQVDPWEKTDPNLLTAMPQKSGMSDFSTDDLFESTVGYAMGV